MKNLLTCMTASAVMLASACAQQPENVSASYVSTSNYTQLTCAQLNEEARLKGEADALRSAAVRNGCGAA